MPIVLIHGTGSSLHTWGEWALKLKENYRVIRMDLPAFGLTGPNKSRDYSIDKYTLFLEEFVAKLKLDSMIFSRKFFRGEYCLELCFKKPRESTETHFSKRKWVANQQTTTLDF